MKHPTFSHTTIARLFLVVLAGISLYTLLTGIPPDKLSLLPYPFYLLTGIPCPGCGMTRPCVALFQGRLTAAWHYHPFSFFLIPLGLSVALVPDYLTGAWLRLSLVIRDLIAIIGIILCLYLWLWRLN